MPGGELTVGVEEELILVDEGNRLLQTGGELLIERVGAECRGLGRASTELYAAEIEFATAVSGDAEGTTACVAASRAALTRAGGRAMAVGVHPAGPFGDARLTDSARYRVIGDALAGLLRTPTAALQVHVGLPDAETAVTAYRGMREHLAVLRALAAGSPFWHGRDSGLASARWGVISAYPRGGVPPVVSCWDDYVTQAEAVAVAAEAPDYTHVWWDLRVQPRFGTVEVRVMDPQPSLGAVAGLTALVQGLALLAVERPTTVDVPSRVLEENDFRVARHGLEAGIVDAEGSMRPVRDVAAALVTAARTALRADGRHDGPLDGIDEILASEPEYARQRRLHRERGIGAVLDDLVLRTARGW